jgi:beta-xylosidase
MSRDASRIIVSLAAAGALAMAPLLGAQQGAEEPPDAYYLFTSFRGNGEDGLHLAWSRDGYKWTALGGDKSYLRPTVGLDHLMRDPCLCQGPDGVFHLVWTTGGRDRIIGYANSKDLLHWSRQKAIPVMADEFIARNAWAPELFYDEPNGQFLIFWSTTIPGRFPETDGTGDGGLNHRIYCCTTKDFETFSPTKLFFDGGFNCIDATILKAGATYVLIVKDETAKPVKKNLRLATSASPGGPYANVSEPFTISWIEGPSAIRIGDDYVVYFDHYTKPQYYGAVRSKDLKTWQDVSKEMSFPPGMRHGTVLKVSKEVIDRLLSAAPGEGGGSKP